MWGLVTLPAWVLLFKSYGLYDRDAKRVSDSTGDDRPWIFHALVIGGLFYKLAPPENLLFREGLIFFVSALVAVF